MSLRVAVIGAGSAGLRHIRNLLELGCEAYFHDPDPARALAVWRECPDAEACSSLSIAESWDAVVIATPHDQHLTYAAECAMYGRPFYVEKPVGTVSQLPYWKQIAAASAKLTTMVGYQCRHHIVAQAMRALVPGESGFFATACDMRTWPGKSYGPLLLEASHDLDLALACGAPATVTEAIIDPHYVAIQLGPHWRVTLEDRADYRREWTIEQRGQSMSVTFQSPEAMGTLMYKDALLHFLECVRENRQTDCPLSEGVKVLEVCATVEQLARKAA